MTSALLWFGVLGAPAAWAVQLTLNYTLEEWFACAPSTMELGRVVGTSVPNFALISSAAFAAIAIAAGVAAFVGYRRLANGNGDEVRARQVWMARAGIMNSVLYLIIIVASFGPPLLLDVCQVSP